MNEQIQNQRTQQESIESMRKADASQIMALMANEVSLNEQLKNQKAEMEAKESKLAAETNQIVA